MRFKPRTDLERIYDVLEQNNSVKPKAKGIINKQLKSLALNVSKRREDDNSEGFTDYGLNSLPKASSNDIMIPKKLKSIKKKAKLVKKTIDNSGAKLLMNDLHHKTHFKGATALTNLKSS